jgi:hypothetical protein
VERIVDYKLPIASLYVILRFGEMIMDYTKVFGYCGRMTIVGMSVGAQ